MRLHALLTPEQRRPRSSRPRPLVIALLSLLLLLALTACSSAPPTSCPQLEPLKVPPLSPEARQRISSEELSRRVSERIETWEQMLSKPPEPASAASASTTR